MGCQVGKSSYQSWMRIPTAWSIMKSRTSPTTRNRSSQTLAHSITCGFRVTKEDPTHKALIGGKICSKVSISFGFVGVFLDTPVACGGSCARERTFTATVTQNTVVHQILNPLCREFQGQYLESVTVSHGQQVPPHNWHRAMDCICPLMLQAKTNFLPVVGGVGEWADILVGLASCLMK